MKMPRYKFRVPHGRAFRYVPKTRQEAKRAALNLTIFRRRRRLERERRELHVPESTSHMKGESAGAAYSRKLREKHGI